MPTRTTSYVCVILWLLHVGSGLVSFGGVIPANYRVIVTIRSAVTISPSECSRGTGNHAMVLRVLAELIRL
jgi:hypothetical protein